MEVSKNVGLFIVVLLSAILVMTVYIVAKPSAAGAVVAASSMAAPSGDYQGYASYEEMMAAHHPGESAQQGVGGCGAEAPVASHDSPVQGSGKMSEYGVTYDQAGYTTLMGYAKSVSLSSVQTQKIVGLNVEIPCCGVKTLAASGNCECGHHVALYGLAKLLASKDYSREQIQSEISVWKEVFFPAGAGGNTGGC